MFAFESRGIGSLPVSALHSVFTQGEVANLLRMGILQISRIKLTDRMPAH